MGEKVKGEKDGDPFIILGIFRTWGKVFLWWWDWICTSYHPRYLNRPWLHTYLCAEN